MRREVEATVPAGVELRGPHAEAQQEYTAYRATDGRCLPPVAGPSQGKRTGDAGLAPFGGWTSLSDPRECSAVPRTTPAILT
jgi:hypothetical protein